MKKTSIIGLIIIAISIGVIISIYADTSTYGNFSEAQEKQSELVVVSHLNKRKKFTYDPHKDANYFAFYAIDNKGKECQVIFNGTKPQDFEKSEQLVITGKMSGENFYASRILMKCPSKYNKDQVEIKANGSSAVKSGI
ncbi:cytochrome c maturation protein CcmE domain-containing protein [Hufsiella ginkgonis]|uniref:Cytochrome c maturation protein CcmE n=1 Tax=Hufsiella ginkgonis TaxID=2695274 RepID=A0A7K1XYH6_9SPHI|nr:cytochrome c maturation protein CcmE [Hufsiella ginkgonis]MXV15596.1 cytochrome c maturation protein CcmE [Hufsiella ginkgonis]